MTLDAILFDLDGTLLDTLDDLADSMNAVLACFGCPAQPVDDYRYHVGDGVRKLALRALRAAGGDAAHVDTAIDAMRHEYLKRWSNKTKLYEGVPELLDRLLERRISLAVLSNKPDDFTQLMVAHFFDPDCFAVVRGVTHLPTEATEATPMPSPAGLLFCHWLDFSAGVSVSLFLGASLIVAAVYGKGTIRNTATVQNDHREPIT